MNINFDQIEHQTGLHFENEADVLFYLRSSIGYLGLHNKNLTNKQYWAVCDIESILKNITEG